MKYIIQALDDAGEVILNESTQLSEVAQKILNQAIAMEPVIKKYSMSDIRKSITWYCEICGEVMTEEEKAKRNFCGDCVLDMIYEHNILDAMEDRREESNAQRYDY